jgi:hypothetical protein
VIRDPRDMLYLLYHVKALQEGASDEWPSPDTKSAGTLILDFPASRTVEVIFVVYKPPSVGTFVIVV